MTLTARALPSLLVVAVALSCAASVHAAVELRDSAGLVQALQAQPPCCVVDARSQASRSKHPLHDAVIYRPGVKIVPTAAVVVVGEDDSGAASAAQALARQHPGKAIFAVKGGIAAWESALRELQAAPVSRAPGSSKGITFVIPHNTCETGTPLQVLQSKPKP